MAKLYALHTRDFDRSIEEAQGAIEMAPNEPLTRSALGTFLSQAGMHDQGIEWASTALRQEHNAAFARFYKPNLAWVLYLAGRYEEALENTRGNEMVAPDVTAATYAHLDHLEEARAIVSDWLKTGPFSIVTASCWAIKEPMKSDYLDDLRKAGLPER